jgi:dynactin 6
MLRSKGVESPSVGSCNTFEARCRVPSTIRISDCCTIGAGCTASPSAFFSQNSQSLEPDANCDTSELGPPDSDPSSLSVSSPAQRLSGTNSQPQSELLPSHSVIFGSSSERRIWSGNGKGQATALYAKHLEYLREVWSDVFQYLLHLAIRLTVAQLPIRCFQNMLG